MKTQKLAEELLRSGVLDTIDAARLILEMEDALGRRVKRRSRTTLLQLFRRVIYAGVNAVLQEEKTVSLATAAWASVEARETHLRPISLRDLRYYVRRLLRVEGCARLMLRNMKPAQCRSILNEAFSNSSSEYVKARSVLHGIFAFGMRHEWCDKNPVDCIEIPRIQETIIEPLTLEQVKRLLHCARGTDMQLSLNLMLFSGIRPAEVARLSSDDICWKENMVIIRPQTSKTGGGRMVPLRGCYQIPNELRVIPQNWQRRWRSLRKQAGFMHWTPDVCRHTFATYHAAHFRNLPALQLEMGHGNLNLLRSRYMRPASANVARCFWALSQLPHEYQRISSRNMCVYPEK